MYLGVSMPTKLLYFPDRGANLLGPWPPKDHQTPPDKLGYKLLIFPAAPPTPIAATEFVHNCHQLEFLPGAKSLDTIPTAC